MSETANLVKQLPTEVGGLPAGPIDRVEHELAPWEKRCHALAGLNKKASKERALRVHFLDQLYLPAHSAFCPADCFDVIEPLVDKTRWINTRPHLPVNVDGCNRCLRVLCNGSQRR